MSGEPPGWVRRGLRAVLLERRLPLRLTYLGGASNTLLRVPLRRLWFRLVLALHERRRREDILVVIGVRNRLDHRLRNALRSLRAQDYPRDLVGIAVVDYGSDSSFAHGLARVCAEFSARSIRVENCKIWNKSHCLNIAIRGARTKYLLSSDADIIFAPSYLREAIAALRRDPLQVVYSQSLDLPESWAADRPDVDPSNLTRLRELAKPRLSSATNTGVNLALTYFYHRVRGYDEAYTHYGAEDDDLAVRFERLGLRPVSIADRSFYLHQWHPKHEGVGGNGLEEHIRKNRAYFESHRSILRNDRGWGEMGGG